MAKKKTAIDTSMLKESESNILLGYKTQAEEIVKVFEETGIQTKEDFENMSAKLKKLTQFMTEIKDASSGMLEPYKKQIELVEGIEKMITKPLKDVSELVRAKMLTFLQEHVKQAKEESDKMIVEVTNKYNQYLEVYRRLRCVKEQILARLFMGEYEVFASQEKKSVDTPATTPEMVLAIKNLVVEKFPPAEAFLKMEAIADEMKSALIEICENIHKIYSDNGFLEAEDVENFKKKPEEILIQAKMWVETMRKTKMAEAEAIVKEAKAGRLRSVWKYTVSDMAQVPEIYTTIEVDKEKIKDFMSNCKDLIENGQQPIPGIQFFKDDTFVNA